jgi:hypothetical protein
MPSLVRCGNVLDPMSVDFWAEADPFGLVRPLAERCPVLTNVRVDWKETPHVQSGPTSPASERRTPRSTWRPTAIRARRGATSSAAAAGSRGGSVCRAAMEDGVRPGRTPSVPKVQKRRIPVVLNVCPAIRMTTSRATPSFFRDSNSSLRC